MPKACFIFGVLALVLLVPNTSAVRANSFITGAYCSRPSVPYGGFSSDWELRSFKSSVASYRRCISDFISEQREAARNHLAAADEAASEWDSFVSSLEYGY